jgi:hypothetical protein
VSGFPLRRCFSEASVGYDETAGDNTMSEDEFAGTDAGIKLNIAHLLAD